MEGIPEYPHTYIEIFYFDKGMRFGYGYDTMSYDILPESIITSVVYLIPDLLRHSYQERTYFEAKTEWQGFGSYRVYDPNE